MQSPDIETLAQQACFSINYQTKTKASQMYLELCRTLSKEQLRELLNRYSQTVLFVTMEQIYKIVPGVSGTNVEALRELFISINENVQFWFGNHPHNDTTLVRGDGKGLDYHVENSISRTIGQCLKYLYLNKDLQEWVLNFIKDRRSARYQLYLWKVFIQTVSVMDNELTFIVYRSLVYNFQEYVIPMIMDGLVPFFMSVYEQIQVNDLIFMQANLSVRQIQNQASNQSDSFNNRNNNNNSNLNLFCPKQQKFTQLVFQVLKQIVTFTYNITYSQFQSQTAVQNCIVSFPDMVTKKLVNKQFTTSIFFITEKLLLFVLQAQTAMLPQSHQSSQSIPPPPIKTTPLVELNKKFLQTSLQCIQKIMLTKLIYVASYVKDQFIRTVLVALSRLVTMVRRLVVVEDGEGMGMGMGVNGGGNAINHTSKEIKLKLQNLHEDTLTLLIDIHSKFVMNVQIPQMHTKKKQYQQWLPNIKGLVINILKNNLIEIENELIIGTIDLVVKFVQQASNPQLKAQVAWYKNFGTEAVMVVLDRMMFQNHSILGGPPNHKIRNYEDFKKTLTTFLRKIRQLACLNLTQVLTQLEPQIIKTFQSNNAIGISNIYFLFSELCDNAVLQRNLLYELPEPALNGYFGKHLLYCLEYIYVYRGYNQSVEIIEVGIMIFLEKLLFQILSYFSYEVYQGGDMGMGMGMGETQGEIKIKSEIYNAIVTHKPDLKSQEFLTFCYQQIAKNLLQSDYTRSSYTFQILTSLLLKFKWGIKRQYFKQTKIAKIILSLCHTLNTQTFDSEKLPLRKELFKILTNISFDDTLDDYRANIGHIIGILKQNMVENKWRVMYDLTGICEAIDTSAIYRFFMISMEKAGLGVEVVMGELFGGIRGLGDNGIGDSKYTTKIQLFKSILRLQTSMIQNKGQRLAGPKNTFYNYKIISSLMPYWHQLLTLPEFTTEQYDQLILQLYYIFSTLLRNSNTNFYILQRTVPCYREFMLLFLRNMVGVAGWVEHFPGLMEQYRVVVAGIGKELLEVVFCNRDGEVVKVFNQIINIIMGFCIKCANSLTEGNTNTIQSLQSYLQTIKNIFKYLRNAKKLEHKLQQLKNMQHLAIGIEIKYNFILTLFKFGISSGKRAARLFEVISKIIYYMDFLAYSTIPKIIGSLGIGEGMAGELGRIWSQGRADSTASLYKNYDMSQAIAKEFQEKASLGNRDISKGKEGFMHNLRNKYGQEIQQSQFVSQLKEWFRKCNLSTMTEPDY